MFAAKNELLTRPSGYQISRSLRFRSSASAYLSRTPASAGNRKTWTWSGWVKRGSLGSGRTLFGRDQNGSGQNFAQLNFNSSDQLNFINFSTTIVNVKTSTDVFRDPSAWYHIVCIFDTSNATASDRIQLYVNNRRITDFASSTDPSPNYDGYINEGSQQHNISSVLVSSRANYFDGYLAEVNFIDGQALTPSSFGAFDSNGIWQPAKYTGSYGTNGFYLNFSDNSGATATTIGKDSSGNSNNWTPNNISVTSGTTYDSMIDSPTNYADGGNGRGNYAVLNPLLTGGTTVSNGNLTSSGTAYAKSQSSFPMQTGKWYAEATLTTLASQDVTVGITSNISNVNDVANPGSYGWGVRLGRKWVNNSITTGFATAVAGNIAGLAFNADTGQLDVYNNNVSVFSITGIPTGAIYNFLNGGGGTAAADTINWNFGQRPFTYTPPSGFSALNTQNLPTPTIAAGNKHFDATIYSGTGATQSVTNSGSFQPDFIWMKNRSSAVDHALYDALRTAMLTSNSTAAEVAGSNVIGYNSNGWLIGSPDSRVNASGSNYIGWQWNAGGAPTTDNVAGAGNVPTAGSVKINGANSSATLAGSIAATRLSANTSAGFSVVTYTGTGANATVGHGLGVAPSMVIIKTRTASDWYVGHTSVGWSGTGYLILNNTGAAGQYGSLAVWQTTAPNSSVISLGTVSGVNANGGNYVAYCFAPVAGYSAAFSYTGNGSADGPMVYLGFRPRWVLCKRTDSTGDWWLIDTSRDTYNVSQNGLNPNLSNAESTGWFIDLLSNGFKIRVAGTGTSMNASGGSYIGYAIAETPFKFSRSR